MKFGTQLVFVGDARVPFSRSLMMLIAKDLGCGELCNSGDEKCAFGTNGSPFAGLGPKSESDPDSVRSLLVNYLVSMREARSNLIPRLSCPT